MSTDAPPAVRALQLRYANLCSYMHNSEIGKVNFERASQELCDIWREWRELENQGGGVYELGE